jgi:hypothetical protein
MHLNRYGFASLVAPIVPARIGPPFRLILPRRPIARDRLGDFRGETVRPLER